MIEKSRLLGDVVGRYTHIDITYAFDRNITKFDWIDDFLKDQEKRVYLEALKKQIGETRKKPIDRDELRAQFLAQIKQANDAKIEQTVEYLKGVQEGTEYRSFLSAIGGDTTKILGSHYYPFIINFTDAQLDKIFSQLPDGYKRDVIEKSLALDRKEIQALEAEIAWEKFPRSRWWFYEDGVPYAYPDGCQWTTFVEIWKGVVSRFKGDVNINGYLMEHENEKLAFQKLGLDKVRKIQSDYDLIKPRSYNIR